MVFCGTAVLFLILSTSYTLFSECLIHKDDDMVLEELFTLRLPSNDHHGRNKRISSLIRKVKGDKDLSYETIWSNGTRTLTVVRVRRPKMNGVTNKKIKSKQTVNLPSSGLQREKRSPKLEVQKRRVFGTDNRKQIDSTTAQSNPYSAIAKVSCGRSCTWICTGTLVSPRHVLTAAHCVYRKTVSSLRVGFLQDDSSSVWYSVTRTNMPNGWIRNKQPRFDYALLTLNSPNVNRGFLNISTLNVRRSSRLYIAGFHLDKPQNSLWESRCFPIASTSETLFHKCDTYRGSSGSGILVKTRLPGKSTTYLVTAIHSGYFRKKRLSFNVACKLTRAKVKQLKRWSRN